MFTHFPRYRNNILSIRKSFHSGKSVNNSIIEADSSKLINKYYHKSVIVLVGLTPIAFLLSPSVLNLPVDLVLGVAFPLHSHVGLNYVISDYVPKQSRSMVRGALMVCTVITIAGLLKLNLSGPGLTESIKGLWRKPKSIKNEK